MPKKNRNHGRYKNRKRKDVRSEERRGEKIIIKEPSPREPDEHPRAYAHRLGFEEKW